MTPSSPPSLAPTGARWLNGLRPLVWSRVPADVLAGVTLAALGIPEVLGYAKIAHMPVVTGLYTLLAPLVVFALVGWSRHLVVGADSATAAIFAAGVAGAAAEGSSAYTALAGLAALMAGGLLLVARVARLGFLANFLSRTVLVGFLTGVGLAVAAGQLGEMLGLEVRGRGTLGQLVAVARAATHTHLATALVTAGTLGLVVGTRALTRRVPGALIAVVVAIALESVAHLGARGVALLGPVPSGLPHAALPAHALAAARRLLAPAAAMFVVILAQSSATARAYAAKHGDTADEDRDLVGLALANAAAAFTGSFVVNGSPTKTQMVDAAGGRSQVATLTTSVAVLVVLLALTRPLAHLPIAVLATVVFVIGLELVDLRGLRAIYAVRRAEFVVALVTAAGVVLLGVEQGIVVAIVASIIDHLRHSYAPKNTVLVVGADGRLHSTPAAPHARSRAGLVIYRFGSSLYYANAQRLADEALGFVRGGAPVAWLCLDGAAIGDVDFTAGAVLRRLADDVGRHGTRLVFSDVSAGVRAQLDRYKVTVLVGESAYLERPADVVVAFDTRATPP